MHHIAHHKKDCENAYETAIHLAAKNILKKHKRLTLPSVSFEVGHHKDSWLISEEKHIIFATVELETKVEDIIRDALMKIGMDLLLVEITVTHKTSEEKIRKAKKYGLSILDIDLSDYDRAFNLEDLVEEVIYNTTRKKWLINIKLEKIKSELFRIHEEKKENRYGFVKCEILGSKK